MTQTPFWIPPATSHNRGCFLTTCCSVSFCSPLLPGLLALLLCKVTALTAALPFVSAASNWSPGQTEVLSVICHLTPFFVLPTNAFAFLHFVNGVWQSCIEFPIVSICTSLSVHHCYSCPQKTVRERERKKYLYLEISYNSLLQDLGVPWFLTQRNVVF